MHKAIHLFKSRTSQAGRGSDFSLRIMSTVVLVFLSMLYGGYRMLTLAFVPSEDSEPNSIVSITTEEMPVGEAVGPAANSSGVVLAPLNSSSGLASDCVSGALRCIDDPVPLVSDLEVFDQPYEFSCEINRNDLPVTQREYVVLDEETFIMISTGIKFLCTYW